MFNRDWAVRWMETAAESIAAARFDLIELDRAIGDGDHGENLDRGFTALTRALHETEPASLPDVLTLAATTLLSTVGGASGVLYGTAFLRAAHTCKGVDVLDAAGIVALIEAARDGIQQRGKAETGDKTMLDAWTSAAESARAALDTGQTPDAIWSAAVSGAKDAADRIEPLIARKGRASYLGERSAGHRDPGAESTVLILTAGIPQ